MRTTLLVGRKEGRKMFNIRKERKQKCLRKGSRQGRKGKKILAKKEGRKKENFLERRK